MKPFKFKRLTIFILAILVTAFLQIIPGHGRQERKSVLILHSYHKAAWTDSLLAGIDSVLGGTADLDMVVEYMDTKRIKTEAYYQTLDEVYKLKYSQSRFDAILTSDDNAYRFALERQDGIFKNAPIVFCGVNRYDPREIEDKPKVTGVVEKGDFEDTLLFASRACPRVATVHIILDQTRTGQINKENLLAVLKQRHPRLGIRFLIDLSLADLTSKLAALPAHDFAFFISYWQDNAGSPVSPDQLSEAFYHSSVPIFGRSEWMLGKGMTGGKCVSGFHQGEAAAQLVKRILAGERASNIPVIQNSPNRFMFDYQLLERYRINQSALPPDSILFREPETTFYEKYGFLIWTAASVIVVLTVLVFILLFNVITRRRTENALHKSEQELTIMNRISEIFLTCHDDEIYGEVLQTVLKASESKNGVFGYIDRDGNLVCPSMTGDVWDRCRMPGKDIVFPRETWGGIWGRALIEKKSLYSNEPFNVPEGHISVTRALDAPIMHRGRVIGNLLVGNKAKDYDQADEDLLKKIANQLAPLLFARLQKEEEELERKTAQQVIEASEARYKAIVEDQTEFICRFKPDGILTFVNQAFCRYHEKSSEELIGIVFFPLLPEEDRAADQDHLASLGPDNPVGSIEHRVIKPNGEIAWQKWTNRAICDSEGRVIEFQAVGRDITERIQAAEALRESEERYRLVAENTIDVIWALDLTTMRLTYASPSVELMTGYSVEEIMKIPIQNRFSPESYTSVMETLEEELALEKSGQRDPGEAKVLEWEEYHKQGHTIAIGSTMSFLRDEKGQPVSVVGVSRDITDLKLAEAELKWHHERFRKVMDSLNALVYVADMTTNELLFVNKYGLDTFGDITGKICWEVLQSGQTGPCDFCTNKRLLDDDGKPVGVYVSEYENTVTGRWFECRDEAIQWVDGRLVRLEIATDITERKRLATQVQQTQKRESLGVVAGGVAHEFNNLLMGMLGNVELALTKLSRQSPVRRYLEQLESLGNRAAEITRQMLDYSGKGRFTAEFINLTTMIADMNALISASVSKKACLRFNLNEGIPFIKGDPGQIRQVIMNLITNASEALGAESGDITITTGSKYCDSGFLEQSDLYEEQEEGEYVFLEIKDTGCGMEPEVIENIFDPFFSKKFAGRGLGLAAVSGIVRGQKGAIRVESEPGRGSSFTVLFPAEKAEDEAAQKSPGLASPNETGNTILVVDDENYILDTVKEMLESFGYSVLTASDGLEGVEIFREKADKIALVLLDLTMPRMGGSEAFREMSGINSDVPVIVVSGYNEEEVSQRFIGQMPAGFIKKPFQLRFLINKISEVLKKE